jgi:hypothetical protein
MSSGAVRALQGKTFSFITPHRAATPGRSEAHGYNPAIQAGIEKELLRKGLKRVDSGGDITVAYLIAIRSGASTSAVSEFFGHGEETEKLLAQAHKRATKLVKEMDENRMVDSRKFKAAALVIDMVDAKSTDLLFRQSVVRPLLVKPSEAARGKALNQALADIFSNL